MARARVVITGIKSIDRKLHTLPYRVQKKVVRQAMRAALKPMLASVKAEASDYTDTGTMRSSFKIKAGKRKVDKQNMLVMIRTSPELVRISAKTGKRVFYPAVVEYGSKTQPPRPFARRGFEGAADTSRKVVIHHLKAGIEREAKHG